MRQSRRPSLHSAGGSNSSGASGRFDLLALAVLDDGCAWIRTLTGFEASAVLLEVEAGRKAGGQAVHAALGTLSAFVWPRKHLKGGWAVWDSLAPFQGEPRGVRQVPGEAWRCPNCGSSKARHPQSDTCWDCTREAVES